MDLDAIKIFMEVMRTGSFAAVARNSNVDPSSISRTITQLETELGFRLFQRTTRRLVATEPAALYFERIQGLVDELERARDEARDVIGSPSGLVRMTASVAYGVTCLMPLLPGLRAAYPDIQLDLLLSDAVVDLVADRVDLAIRLGPRPDGAYIGSRLAPTRYRVCASPGYVERNSKPQRPEDITAQDCALFPYSGYRTMWRFRTDGGEIYEVPVHGSLIISNALALRQAACDGLAPALLADWLVGPDVKAGRLVDLFPRYEVTATDFDTAAWVLYPSRAYLPRKVRVVIDVLKAHLGATRS